MKNYKIVFLILTILIVLISGVLVGRGTNKDIKIGTETTTVSVLIHDTIITKQVEKEIQSIIKYDTIYLDTNKLIDTSICYSFEKTENDGTYIKAEICSDSFSIDKPLDLTSNIYYLPAPDSIEQIFRIDTLAQKPNWKKYVLITTVLTIGGVVLGNLMQR